MQVKTYFLKSLESFLDEDDLHIFEGDFSQLKIADWDQLFFICCERKKVSISIEMFHFLKGNKKDKNLFLLPKKIHVTSSEYVIIISNRIKSFKILSICPFFLLQSLWQSNLPNRTKLSLNNCLQDVSKRKVNI